MGSQAKPCPFCGVRPEVHSLKRGRMVVHEQNGCLVTVTRGQSMIRAFSLSWWNKRAKPVAAKKEKSRG